MRRASDGAVALQPGKEVCKVVDPRERDRLELAGFDAHVPTAVFCCAQLIFGGSRGFAYHDHLVRVHRGPVFGTKYIRALDRRQGPKLFLRARGR